MKADETKLLEFIGQNKKTFNIPVYQRNYDWKRSHCDRLFNDIISMIDNNKESHFLGTIVYVFGEAEANFSELIVIDGQQRLTSIMLLLKAIMDNSDDEDINEEIYEEYLINKRAPEKYRLKLKTVQSDNSTYQNIIDGNEELEDTNLKRNYEFFCEKIIDEKQKRNIKTIYNAIHKLSIVYIQLDKEKENPQLIFESLNSTGLDLTPADLIRNYLLMGHNYSIQSRYYYNYWAKIEKFLTSNLISSFIRDFLTFKTDIIPKENKVYESFKRYCENNEYINGNLEELLIELVMYAKWYQWFTYKNSPYPNINEKLDEIKKIKSTVTYPFLLYLFNECFNILSIDTDELENVLDVLISYLFRRYLCDIPTYGLNKVFSLLKRDIEKNWKSDLSFTKNVEIILLMKKSGAIFPRNELLKQRILISDVYNFRHKKYLFEKLERHDNKEPLEFTDLTIEHIMPQKLTSKWRADLGQNYADIHDKYLHNIGNLTLTGYNGELSNKSFEDKKEILAHSNIYTNRTISEANQWGKNEIINRADALADKAIDVWKFPDVDQEHLKSNNIDTDNEIGIVEDVDVTGRSPYQLTFIGEKMPISTWRELFIKACELCYQYDIEIFKTLINHKDFIGRNRIIISNEKGNSGSFHELADSIYLQVNLSANSLLNYTKLVIEKYGDELESEVSYRIR